MTEQGWAVLEEVGGKATAEILRGLLEAQGIPVLLSQEGVGEFVYPTSFTRVQVLVPEDGLEGARQIMKEYRLGSFAAENELENISPEGESAERDEESRPA